MSKDSLFETQEQPIAKATDEERFGNRFTVEALIASGRSSMLFRAKDQASGRDVALKVLRPLEHESAERFLAEAEVLARLANPTIVHHVAHGLTPQNQPYLASDWLNGENLAQRLARGSLAPEVAARLGARVLQAMTAAHREGLVHRDLKPSNLFLPDQDPARVVVIDFGIGLDGPTPTTLPRAGAATGPCYLAPEQVRGPVTLDGRTDVFALGCVLYECATGQCLFPENPWVANDGSPIQCSAVPQPLRAIVERMLAPRREDRPADLERLSAEMLELARVLEGIETRFAISVSPRGDLRVLFEKGPHEPPATLAGHLLPCFGRERELDLLEGLWHEVCEHSVARAIVISAPMGGGKTRLRQELCERVKRHGPAFELVVGGGDPLQDGAPMSLLRPALLCAAGLTGGEPANVKRQRLLAMVEHHVPPGQAQRVAAFLGEAAQIPFPDDLPALHAARLNPRLMVDHIRLAWLDWLEGACSRHPVMLVLEDLHWGDNASAALTKTALRVLHDRPLLVMALAQPEVDRRFINLWRDRAPQRMHLAPLSSRQSQRLIEYVAGALPESRTKEMLERAQGNPFYLGELLRALLGGGQARPPPDTVLHAVQERLRALNPESRLAVGACSVLGRGFRAEAVQAVIESDDHVDMERALDLLEEQEILFSHTTVAGREFSFRHALLRQAAYDMLPADERRLGHLWAGRFLEQMGDADAHVLAEHFERGRNSARAVHWLRQSAERALRVDDAIETLALVNRALGLGASREDENALRAVEAQLHLWHEEYAEAESAARVAVSSRGSETRWRAMSSLSAALSAQSKNKDLARLLAAIREPPDEPELVGGWVNCLCNAVPFLVTNASSQAREMIVNQVEEHLKKAGADAPWLGDAESLLAHLAQAMSRPLQALAGFERSARHHARWENRRAECEARANLGHLLLLTGQLEAAEACLRPLMESSQRLELTLLPGRIAVNLARVLAYRGSWDEARDLGLQALAMAEARHDRLLRGWAEAGLSLTEWRAGNHPAAEKHAIAGIASFEMNGTGGCFAQALLARALLAQTRISEALQHAREARSRLDNQRVIDGVEGTSHVVLAECVLATGDRPVAHEILREANERLRELADTIDEATTRRSFLTGLPEHQRLLQLCRQAGVASLVVP